MDVIKVCPFCGCSPEAQVHEYVEHIRYSVQCINAECPAEGVYTHKEYSSKKAIEMWNTREKT